MHMIPIESYQIFIGLESSCFVLKVLKNKNDYALAEKAVEERRKE